MTPINGFDNQTTVAEAPRYPCGHSIVTEPGFPGRVYQTCPICDLAAAQQEIERLREAVGALLPESPWDVDQDCRYCNSHYEGHDDDCAWAKAREALGSIQPEERVIAE